MEEIEFEKMQSEKKSITVYRITFPNGYTAPAPGQPLYLPLKKLIIQDPNSLIGCVVIVPNIDGCRVQGIYNDSLVISIPEREVFSVRSDQSIAILPNTQKLKF